MYDVAVVGAGAAGLMAAIFAARSGARVLLLEGQGRIGAKILISGGGRCNVTNDRVASADFNGNRNAIAKVLRTFDVAACTSFFEEIGVPLVREETGKLFPVSNRAATVLEGLLDAAASAGVEIRKGARVALLERRDSAFPSFMIDNEIEARALVLATGGRTVPKTGSDGGGYELARTLGHSITHTFPALVPLLLPADHFLPRLSGISLPVELSVRTEAGRVLERVEGAMLMTHFGISGPAVLDVSRHWIAHQPARLVVNFLPGETIETLEAALLSEVNANPRATVTSFLRRYLPERLAERLGGPELNRLPKDERRRIARSLIELVLPVTRNRGFDYAEVTAGGVPLSEVELATMASRRSAGLYLCGEILDVDGRIGGFNFHWAWATGKLAGLSAARIRSASQVP